MFVAVFMLPAKAVQTKSWFPKTSALFNVGTFQYQTFPDFVGNAGNRPHLLSIFTETVEKRLSLQAAGIVI